jgi:hypothetical protein
MGSGPYQKNALKFGFIEKPWIKKLRYWAASINFNAARNINNFIKTRLEITGTGLHVLSTVEQTSCSTIFKTNWRFTCCSHL